jgi:hypothetical protein
MARANFAFVFERLVSKNNQALPYRLRLMGTKKRVYGHPLLKTHRLFQFPVIWQTD